MRKFLFLISSILFFIFSAIPVNVALDSTKVSNQAAEAYYAQRYDESESLYTGLLKTGKISGHLYYNLGNIAVNQGKPGEAVWYYEKALRLMPRDADLRANISFVKNRLGEPFETEIPLLSFSRLFFFWNSWLTLGESFLFWGVTVALFFVFATFSLFGWGHKLKNVVLLSLMMMLVTTAATSVKLYEEKGIDWAVILENNVGVKPTFLEGQKAWFNLRAGDKVRVVSRQEVGDQKWIQIEVRGGQKGWILEEEGGLI